MKTILFQGDSITDAGRSREDGSNLGLGYPTLVKGEMGFDYAGQYEFVNKGISGNRIVDLYARLKVDFINIKPDVISILIGVNDVWHELSIQNGVDNEKFYKIYCMLIEEIKEALPNTKIMILEPFVLKGTATESNWDYFASETKLRAKMAKKVAEKYGLTFLSLQDKFDQALKLCPPDYWLVDGVHPTTMGHELIKREWIKAFKTLAF